MTNKKISELPTALNAEGSDVFPIARSSQTRKLSVDQVKSYISNYTNTGLPSVTNIYQALDALTSAVNNITPYRIVVENNTSSVSLKTIETISSVIPDSNLPANVHWDLLLNFDQGSNSYSYKFSVDARISKPSSGYDVDYTVTSINFTSSIESHIPEIVISGGSIVLRCSMPPYSKIICMRSIVIKTNL